MCVWCLHNKNSGRYESFDFNKLLCKPDLFQFCRLWEAAGMRLDCWVLRMMPRGKSLKRVIESNLVDCSQLEFETLSLFVKTQGSTKILHVRNIDSLNSHCEHSKKSFVMDNKIHLNSLPCAKFPLPHFPHANPFKPKITFDLNLSFPLL